MARSCGCEVLYRPAELAADDTPMLPVVRHALEAVEAGEGNRFDYAVILQPTVPLRTGDDIDRALELLVETGADSVISVYQVFDHHPARMYRLVDGRLVPYAPEPSGRLRQDLPPVYHRNGAIYAFRRGLIEEVGRAPTVGRPILYGTTFEFLQHFGLSSLDELPSLDSLPASEGV